jgi:mono/diheme cytochrome c family protein
MNQTFSISAALAWSPKIYHGIVPVEENGSVFFEAPSGRALYFQLLDKDYRLVRSMRTFIQAAPGTTRSCIGCHEYNKAPDPSKFRLSSRKPRKPVDESWGSGYLDYASMIQPILDKRCVSCHGGEKGIAGGVDLSGGWTEYFNISYENLTARREKQYIADLIAGICCMNGTAEWSCKIFDPYEHGSGKAPLARILSKAPHREINGLTQTERELLLTWMDSNGIYYGTWDYTKAGPRLKEYAPLRGELVKIMQQNNCVQCHGDDRKQIKRFDDWINLEKPEMSRILRAPLDPKSSGGYGLGLCRERKVAPNFSRLGQIFKAGYAHQVLPLEKFPSQKWIAWKESLKGTPVFSFSGTDAPVYKLMLEKISEARARQLATPRVDMPNAADTNGGIVAGRSRQIIPQPLPEVMPTPKVEITPLGARITWERSSRTIGLITEIHRGTAPDFKPDEKTRIGRTERFEWTDKTPAAGVVYYAIVFVSDPAETCGTCKSGATLNYAETPTAGGTDAVAATSDAALVVSGLHRIEDRCPLSMTAPMRSEPAWCRVELPVPGKR